MLGASAQQSDMCPPSLAETITTYPDSCTNSVRDGFSRSRVTAPRRGSRRPGPRQSGAQASRFALLASRMQPWLRADPSGSSSCLVTLGA